LLTCFEKLEFDLPSALIAALVDLLDRMPSGPLTSTSVEAIGNDQGVYQLFLDDQLVYVGKTDAEAGLQARLKRHAKKILGRQRLDPGRVTFKAVRIYVFTAMDLEQSLIKHYNLNSGNSWNSSGFGANDPGRERDTTKLANHHFDKKYPIDLQIEAEINLNSVPPSVYEVLSALKQTVPYLIRFQNNSGRSRMPHGDLEGTKVSLPIKPCTVEAILQAVRNALGATWQITALPGYVTIYKETAHYSEGRIIL
jgi:hypothetical protein